MEELQQRLPRPHLPNHRSFERLYWYAWNIGERQIRHGTAENGFAERYADAAFNGNLFQWDTCLIAFFARYNPQSLPITAALDSLYAKQEPNGAICREYRHENGAALWPHGSGDYINPPLFAWAEWGLYQHTADTERLQQVLPVLVRYYEWMGRYYRDAQGLYWISSMGSGMDNSPRFAAAWVDISCQQALAARCIALIAGELGNQALAERFRAEHHALAALINHTMWDDQAGIYWDLDGKGVPTRTLTLAPFWALLAEVASPAQARQLARHLSDPQTFWRHHPWPSLAASEPLYATHGDYWRGGVWAPTNYAIMAGLARYGLYDVARAAALRHLGAMARIYGETGTIWENYRPDDDGHGTPARPEFVGWSGLGPIAMLIEYILGVEINAPARLITWRVVEPGPHGIENLLVGTARARLHITADGTIEAESSEPLTLRVIREGREENLSL
jgi:glycogen debranching enzyme